MPHIISQSNRYTYKPQFRNAYFRIYNKSYCKTKQRITNKEMKRKKETLTLDLKLFFEIIYSILIRFIKKATNSVGAMVR